MELTDCARTNSRALELRSPKYDYDEMRKYYMFVSLNASRLAHAVCFVLRVRIIC